jgi:uncharacterized protein (DUF58 family)
MNAALAPTTRAAALIGVLMLLSVFTLWDASLRVWVIAADVVVLVGLAVDAIVSRSARMFVDRSHPRVGLRGEWVQVELTVRSEVPWSSDAVVHDRVFAQADADRTAVKLRLSPNARAAVNYRVRPLQRGAHLLGPARTEITSRFGFWRVIHDAGDASTLDVYPVVRGLAGLPLQALRDSTPGTHRAARGSAGEHEFDRLRDWLPDDTIRHVDWRATARRGRMTVRQYKSEENQNIMICLDGGRTMSSEVQGRPLFDYAMEAGLALAQLAVRSGDNAGCMVWSDRVSAWMPPARGASVVPAMVRALYDQYASLDQADDQLATRALGKLSRRSLLVWFTRLEDTPMAEQLVSHVRLLDRRHLVLVVLLKDAELERLAYQVDPDAGADSPWIAAGAALLLQEQRHAGKALQDAGALVLETEVNGLTPQVINTYLDVKARHWL